jgi:hypothetical protein
MSGVRTRPPGLMRRVFRWESGRGGLRPLTRHGSPRRSAWVVCCVRVRVYVGVCGCVVAIGVMWMNPVKKKQSRWTDIQNRKHCSKRGEARCEMGIFFLPSPQACTLRRPHSPPRERVLPFSNPPTIHTYQGISTSAHTHAYRHSLIHVHTYSFTLSHRHTLRLCPGESVEGDS